MAPVWLFETVHDVGCHLAEASVLSTSSSIARLLNDCRLGNMLLHPHLQVRRTIYCWHTRAARRSGLPRERFSPMALFGHSAMSDLSPQCAPKPTSADTFGFMGSRPSRTVGLSEFQ